MANFNSPLNLSDEERQQTLSMDELFNRTPLRPRALRRLPMFVPEVEEVFSESSSFYHSEMDFGETVPRPQLQRQNAMPLNVEDIPLPTGPAPLSATLPIVLFIDLTDLDETVEGETSVWEPDFEDDEIPPQEFTIPYLDVLEVVPNDFLCPICRGVEREDVVAHPCSLHHFHFECLRDWLKYHRECPLCRRVRIFVKFDNLANSCIIILLFIF